MGTQNSRNNTSIDYKLIKRYFTQMPAAKSCIGLGIFGILMTLLCLATGIPELGIFTLILAAVFLLAGIGLLKNMPTDEEVDNVATSQLASLMDRALIKLGIDEDEVKEIPPIIFHGYEYSVLTPGINLALGATLFKLGKDNRLRTNHYRVVMFFFSSNELYCYKYDFSLTEDSKKESTDTYFYKDIVSVSTETETASFLVTQNYNYENFKLTTTGGTSISCSVREDEVEDAQRSIKGMRSLIKEKKQA